jgi:hypothetical protein
MKDWNEVPEAVGPQSEGVLNNVQYGDPGYPSIGTIPPLMSPGMRDRERALAAEQYERRLVVERAALAAGVTALEAAATADRILREARETADKAASST